MIDDYLPRKLSVLNQWLKNFALKLELHANKLGIKPEIVARVQNDALFVAYLFSMMTTARATLQGLNSFKNLALYSSNTSAQLTAPLVNLPAIPDGVELTGAIVKNIRKVVRQIKASGNYSSSLGIEFAIIAGGAAEKSPEETFPPIKIEALSNDCVQIKFKKYRHQSVRIEMRREGEENFSFINVATHSPFTDETKSIGGRAEVRYFRFIYYDSNKPAGVYSPVYTISTRP